MNTVTATQDQSLAMFETLSSILKTPLTQNYGEFFLNVNNPLAKGTVRGSKVLENKIYIEFDLICHQDITLELVDHTWNPIHFMYCHQNTIVTTFKKNKTSNTIGEYQTSIVANKSQNALLHFEPNVPVKLTIISVCLPADKDNTTSIAGNIHELFKDRFVDDQYIYSGSLNLKIFEQSTKLNQMKEEGVVRKLMIEGIVQVILAMEIQHHQNDLDDAANMNHMLTREELKTIHQLAQEIRENIDTQYTLRLLTEKTGISAVKLQEGFKHLFGRTVTDFIKNVRLEISEEMIKSTDLTISEIIYSIGFTSRSYFSKIFKERYNCSPSTYRDDKKVRALSA